MRDWLVKAAVVWVGAAPLVVVGASAWVIAAPFARNREARAWHERCLSAIARADLEADPEETCAGRQVMSRP